MALAIAALLTLAILIAVPAALGFLVYEDWAKARDFRLNVLPELERQAAARRADRAARA